MARRRGSTITGKALGQARDVAFWHSSACKAVQLPNALSGFSGSTVSPFHHIKPDPGNDPTEKEKAPRSPAKSRAAAPVSSPPARSPASFDAKARAKEITAMKRRIAELEAILRNIEVQSKKKVRKQQSRKPPKANGNELDASSDGQPRFEGGLHWLQGGSPGLGKKD
jgi:hypothetical protein